MDFHSAQQRVRELRKLLEYHNYKYYVEDSPEIDDYEYDLFMNELIELETKYPVLVIPSSPSQRVGGKASGKFESVVHQIQMESLQDAFSFDELRDFDNRIKIANENKTDLVISIHQNYYKDSKYKGTQIFYKGNKKLAEYLQNNINANRKIKEISNNLYMYNKIKGDVLLIECGFLSNSSDRNKLTDKTYQKEYSKKLSRYIALYFKENLN